MTTFTRAGGLALALLLALVLPASAGGQRPFKAAFTGTGIAVDQRCGPAALTLGFALTGTATHLGRLSGLGTNCTTFDLATEAVPILDGIATLTAADGSTLTTAFEGGQAAPVGGIATYAHEHVVIDGTGRFANADGAFTVTGTIDFATFGVVGTVSGWLRY